LYRKNEKKIGRGGAIKKIFLFFSVWRNKWVRDIIISLVNSMVLKIDELYRFIGVIIIKKQLEFRLGIRTQAVEK